MSDPFSSPPLVTVYITNHNYGRYLDQAIRSVLKQTLTDFELIVIDDGSTDDSREIIERYARRDKLIPIFQQNKGLNVTNNIALRASRGRYLMRLDADDYLDENALMILSGVLDRKQDVDLVFPDYYRIDEEGQVLEIVRRHDFSEVTLLDQPANGACTLLRKQRLQELGGYDEAFRSQDGYDLWLRLTRRYQVQNVNLPLFYYRQHPRSLTRNECHILETRAGIVEKHAQRIDRRLKVVAIIPVRGRQADPQSSAMRLLGGRPLIDWTVRAALESKRLSGVILTTPDEELLDYVSANYAERIFPVRRSRDLASPNTYIEDTVFHALRAYGSAPDALALLYIECPFRTPQQVDWAVDVMEVFGTDTVIAVRPDTDIFYQHKGAGLEPLRKNSLLRLEREELYREVGQMRVVRRVFLERERRVVGGRIGHIVLDPRSSLYLSSEWDWEIAESQAGRLLRAAEAVERP